jgi:hypothetical protein
VKGRCASSAKYIRNGCRCAQVDIVTMWRLCWRERALWRHIGNTALRMLMYKTSQLMPTVKQVLRCVYLLCNQQGLKPALLPSRPRGSEQTRALSPSLCTHRTDTASMIFVQSWDRFRTPIPNYCHLIGHESPSTTLWGFTSSNSASGAAVLMAG